MPPPKTRNSKLNEQDEIHEEDENDEHDEPEDNESDEIDREIEELEREEQRLTKLEKLRALRQKVEILKRKQSPKHVDVSVDDVEKKAQKVLARLRLNGDISTSEDQDASPNPTSYSSSDTNQSSRSTRIHRKKHCQKRGKPSHVHSEHLRYQYASRNMKIRQFDLALFMACELDDIKQKARKPLGDRNIIFQHLEHLIKIKIFCITNGEQLLIIIMLYLMRSGLNDQSGEMRLFISSSHRNICRENSNTTSFLLHVLAQG